MHGMTTSKSANAQQAKTLYVYENTKKKVCKTKSAILFDTICILYYNF